MQLATISKYTSLLSLVILSACGGGGDGSPAPVNSPAVVVTPDPVLSATPLNLNGALVVGVDAWSEGSSGLGGHGQAIGGVSCLVTEDYHVHAHLAIIKNGQALAIPPNIGLTGCAYELHTHDRSGILHVETAAYHRLTLGQFFSVWGQPFTSSNVAGIVGLPISVYINDDGKLSLYKGDPADIELSKHREITIVVGTPVTQIPSYKWDSSL